MIGRSEVFQPVDRFSKGQWEEFEKYYADESLDRYIMPEPYGVERIVLSRDRFEPHQLVIDLISFERILPVWQGALDLSSFE